MTSPNPIATSIGGAPPAAPPLADAEKANILLVDDSPAKLLTLETILADLGQNLVQASSGREALRKLLNQDFAVILLDVNMPDIDGFETAKLIRERQRSERTPIIFVSAISRTDTHASMGYSLGAVDYIFTPIVPEVLRTKVGVFVELFLQAREIRRNAEQLRIMEQREHEARLHENRERISAIFRQSAVGVAQTDLAGRILLANDRFCRMMGRAASDLLDRRLAELTHPDDRPRESNLLERMAAGEGGDCVLEKRCLRPDGSTVWLNTSIVCIRDLDGRPQAVLVIAQDIGERKVAEQQLIRHRDHLEEVVAERTELLRRSERLASLGTLAAGIAHEINNPLNAIMATAQYALRYDDANPKQSFETITREVQRAAQIIKNVLKFARDEATPKTAGQLNEVIRHAADLARLYISSPGLSIQLGLAQQLPPVRMNTTEMEQVLVNLISNAAEAAGGDVIVTLNSECVGDEIQLVVSDNGPGISPEIRSRIFDPFFSTNRRNGGCGLGLSITHSIIADHGGRITVEGRPDRGTNFVIRLPAQTTSTD